ncbi:nitrate- and nitrite sensing domain-containing protein [Longispora sp. NPDC051575]|uniref:sensor histidine kinase n=1 Tax=Longispora sp. NPDC051575 TaxID=3154943 RepID=UPI00341BE450
MKFRSTRVRTKVVALLLSLFALWAFAAGVTLREGLGLLDVSTLSEDLGKPTESLVVALQQERRLSVVYLGNSAADQRTALTAQRAKTNEARDTFKRLGGGADVRSAASDALQGRIDDVFKQLDGLTATRDAVDAGSVDRAKAARAYTALIAAGFRIYGSMSSLDDQDITRQSQNLIAFSHAREVLAQEDALLAGVIAAGKFGAGEYEQFVALVGTQRFLYSAAVAELTAEDRARYEEIAAAQGLSGMRAFEDRAVEKGRLGVAAPVDGAAWKSTVEQAFSDLRGLELSAADGLVERAKPAAMGVIVRLLLAGGLGLIAVIASIVISITTARTLAAQLTRLREAAWELSTTRLPGVVERLRRGEEVDVSVEAPPLPTGDDEIGALSRAFNSVQQTAVETAVEQAALRQGVRDVFLSLARRTQALVHRQLKLLDVMERREKNSPEELADLFRVDHLATRMRRNAENLIVLSGATAGRGWRNPVPLMDVVRGALAEVEDYERVRVLPIGPVALAGRAVGDVIHLLAELIENATAYSPPDTPVQVTGQRVANGFVIEVEDRGLGVSPEDMEAANERMKNPPEFKLTGSAHLGLYVVGKLAGRHDIQVRLRDSPYGGTTAIVLVPTSLVVDGPDEPAATPSVVEPVRIVPGPRPVRTPHRTLEVVPAPRGPILPDRGPEPDIDVHQQTDTPESQGGEPEVPESTPSGLPRRVRQASLAAPLREQPAPVVAPVAEPTGRAPEEIRSMIGSYQRATRRGRREAEKTPETPAPPAEVDQPTS